MAIMEQREPGGSERSGGSFLLEVIAVTWNESHDRGHRAAQKRNTNCRSFRFNYPTSEVTESPTLEDSQNSLLHIHGHFHDFENVAKMLQRDKEI